MTFGPDFNHFQELRSFPKSWRFRKAVLHKFFSWLHIFQKFRQTHFNLLLAIEKQIIFHHKSFSLFSPPQATSRSLSPTNRHLHQTIANVVWFLPTRRFRHLPPAYSISPNYQYGRPLEPSLLDARHGAGGRGCRTSRTGVPTHSVGTRKWWATVNHVDHHHPT